MGHNDGQEDGLALGPQACLENGEHDNVRTDGAKPGGGTSQDRQRGSDSGQEGQGGVHDDKSVGRGG